MRTGAGFYKDLEQLSRELDIIFNSTQDAMFLAQVDESEFRYLRNNSSHQKLTGFSTKDIKGKTPLELLGPDLGSLMQTNYQKCVDSKAPIIYEETITFPAGTRDWLVSISPMLEGGQVKYIVGARKDITLRKKAEAEKEELLAKFQAMFDGHQAVVLLIEPISGKIVDANPAALKFFGYPKNKILQLAIEDIHLEPADKVKQMRLMALARKQKYSLCPYRLKSGEVRMTDVYTSPIIHDGRKLLFSIIFDVTDRERYKNELYLEKETLRTTLLSIGDGIITTDKKGRITAMNKVAEDISGWTLKEVEGRPFSQIFRLINEKTGIGVENLVDRVLTEGAIVGLANHTLLLTKDGKKVPIADSAAPIKDHFDRVYGVVIVFRDVTQERKYRQRITRLSQRDFLTGLSNRRFVHQEMERLKDGSDHLPMVVVMADINGLRLVNKVFGHQEGDQVLKRAAQILKNSFRRGDLVARWGGDEFLILLPRTRAESAARIARSVEEAAANSNGLITNISIALGLAVMETADQTFDQLLQKAEEDMYRHKLLMGKSHRNAILNTMLSTLYEKSQETEQHAMRLKEYSVALGKKLGLSPPELEELELLALLHDIGKVGVDAKTLNKPDLLSPAEWEEIKKHPEIGYRIASNIPELSNVAKYILYHHERWDGKGYPRGLKGKKIPLLCRILALADAFDAMISTRPYRKTMNREQALAEIKRNSGSQFDPELAKLFIKLVTTDAAPAGNGMVI